VRQEREACEKQLTEAIKNETEKCEQLLKVNNKILCMLWFHICVFCGRNKVKDYFKHWRRKEKNHNKKLKRH